MYSEEAQRVRKARYVTQKKEIHFYNKTRMSIQGKRYAVGNPKHPYNEVYNTQGLKAVLREMGITESTVNVIRKSVLALYDKHVQGEVYVITNPAWEGWVKVGMAIDAEDRLKSYQTSSPLRDYVLYYSYPTEDRRKSESEAHDKLEQKYDRRNEWFYCTPDQAKETLNEAI
jgi:hypothetical protein